MKGQMEIVHEHEHFISLYIKLYINFKAQYVMLILTIQIKMGGGEQHY